MFVFYPLIITSLSIIPVRSILDKIVSISHGDFIYAPELIDGKNGSIELQKAAKKLAKSILADGVKLLAL